MRRCEESGRETDQRASVLVDYIVGLIGNYWGSLSGYVCRKELSSCVKLAQARGRGWMEWLLQEIMEV